MRFLLKRKKVLFCFSFCFEAKILKRKERKKNWKKRKLVCFFRLSARKLSKTDPFSIHLAPKLKFFVQNRLPLHTLQVLLSYTGRSGGDDPVRVGGDGEPERRTPRLRGGQAARPATVRHSQSGFRRRGKRRQRGRFLQRRRRRQRYPGFSGRVLCGPGLFLKLCSGTQCWGSGY